MFEKFCEARTQIWGSESHACVLVYHPRTDRFYAETEFDTKRLTEKNYERVLNDMFYDYCVEKAGWMGVS